MKKIGYAFAFSFMVLLLTFQSRLFTWALGVHRDYSGYASSPNADYEEPEQAEMPREEQISGEEPIPEHALILEQAQIQLQTMKSSRASNVLTITGSGTHEEMAMTQGKPGVYLLFQGAQYYHGFNEMISDHSKEGTSRQLDGIWEYYQKNSSKSVTKLETEIWVGTGSYSNAEKVKIADAITIQNSTDTSTGAWNTVVTVTNPHPRLTGVMFYYYAPHLADYGGVTIFPLGGQQAVNGAAAAHTHTGISRTEPSCLLPGAITGTCAMCGTVNETIPALGHAIPPYYDTESVPGYKIKNCARCNARLETIANQYQVVYEGNGSTGGRMAGFSQQVGTPFLIAGNDFIRLGYYFTNWNTLASGAGSIFREGQSAENLTMKDQDIVHLYAQWEANTYEVSFDPNGGICEEEKREITYDTPYGQLPSAVKVDYLFQGWLQEGEEEAVTEGTLYKIAENTCLKALWKLNFEDLGNGTNRRPGEDGIMGSPDDHYFYNGRDGEAGTEDDLPLNPGNDGIYGTGDDWYQADSGQIHSGLDEIFDTKDDYIDKEDGTNKRTGEDGDWETEDDELWWNGPDGLPGTVDDQQIHPGMDKEYGTGDDFIDNGDGTNRRPGPDGIWGTEDDEIWENGPDQQPGTEDDVKKVENDPPAREKPDGNNSGGNSDNSGNGSDGSSGSGSGNSSGGGAGSGSGNNTGNGSGSSGGSTGGGSGNSGSSAGGGSGGGFRGSSGSSSGSAQGGPGIKGGSVTDLGKGKSGEWEKLPDGWTFRYTEGGKAKDEWCYLYYGVTGRTDWYRFGLDEYMKIGWYQDKDGRWYFLHTVSDGTLGHMKTGWYLDGDGSWYYLNPVSDGYRGAMVTGWHLIDGKWYYFNPGPQGKLGAMYAGCVTPDGYLVGEDGARID